MRLTNGQRQNQQLTLPFMAEGMGEACVTDKGAETCVTGHGNESPVIPEQLMEEVYEKGNLEKALGRVMSNKGAPGVDRMTVHELEDYLKRCWPTVKAQLLGGTYKPEPVRRVEIPKPNGGKRQIGIPTVLDRFIQQAVMQVLQRYWEPTFSEHSYGFRPKRRAQGAVSTAQGYVNEGYGHVVDIDLEKFFDQVNHDRLMGTLAKRVKDKRMLRLIRAYLNAGVMEDGLVEWATRGTPQGGPLSPLLSNIVLDEWDRELEKRGHKFVRYADDCNIYVRSQRAGERVMKSMCEFITKRLKLKVNEKKSAVGLPQERQILGFSILKGKRAIRLISPKAIKRFKDRIRKETRRTKETMKEHVGRLATYMRGWAGYYGFCETPGTLRDLEAWVRRRLRCLIWKQWQDSRRYRELRRRGIEQWQAWNIANGAKGPWRVSRSRALATLYPNDYFYQMGLPKMTVWKMA